MAELIRRWAAATSRSTSSGKLVVVAVYAGLYELTPLRMPADGPGWSPDGSGGGARG